MPKRNFEIGKVFLVLPIEKWGGFSTTLVYHKPPFNQPSGDYIRHAADGKDICVLLLDCTINPSVK